MPGGRYATAPDGYRVGVAHSKHDYVILRELGRKDADGDTHLHVPADPLGRVAWAAGGEHHGELPGAVREARAAGASWADIADAIGSTTEDVVRAEYGD